MIGRGLVPAMLLNVLVLIAPGVLWGRLRLDDPVLGCFLAIASALVLADSPTIGRPLKLGRSHHDRRTVHLAAATGGLVLMVFWASLLEHAIGSPARPGPANLLGGVLMLVGVGLRAAAVRALGADFITEPGNGPLVDRGLYGWIRHPSEAGNLAVSLGASLLLGSVAGLGLTLALLFPLVVFRVRIEDQDLRDRFGDRFDRHASQVGSLVPSFAIRFRASQLPPEEQPAGPPDWKRDPGGQGLANRPSVGQDEGD